MRLASLPFSFAQNRNHETDITKDKTEEEEKIDKNRRKKKQKKRKHVPMRLASLAFSTAAQNRNQETENVKCFIQHHLKLAWGI